MPHALMRGVIVTLVLLGCLAAGPAGVERLFVSNEKDNTVTVVDANSLQVIKTIPVGARPRGMLLSKDGKEL
jgi:YVTN family beta-propeller protein